jgi:transketolase
MRDAFAEAVMLERGVHPNLVVLDGDNATSTRTSRFAERFPDSFVNVGIAEQNLIGVSAGLALAGHLPLACAFAAMVVGRAGEQIMQSVAYQGLTVKIAGHYAGMSGAREGAPHHSIADLAFLRSVPGMAVWMPASDEDVADCLSIMLAEPGPGYIRLSRDSVASQPAASVGQASSGYRHLFADRDDVVIVAGGAVVGEAVVAAETLTDSGIATSVFTVLRLKPLPVPELLESVSQAGLVVTVEEHSIVGGIGSAVAEVIAEAGSSTRLLRLGMDDVFTETGSHGELLAKHGLVAASISARVAESVGVAVGTG